MSSADTNNIGIKLQAAGENLNTWGDPNLNNALIVLSNLASKFKTIQISGDYTVSETLYSTTNDTEVALIKLTPNGVAAAFNFVMPARNKRLILWNTTGYTATPKLAASSGFSLPNNGIAVLTCDGTDVYNSSPTHAGTTTQDTSSNAFALWGAVQTAIATAGLPATAGTWLASATDATAGYGIQKVQGEGSVTVTLRNPGVNEYLGIGFTFDEGQTALYGRIYSL